MQRTVTETCVATSDPGVIRAGGNLRLSSSAIANDRSRIVAGGDVLGSVDALHNTVAQGHGRTRWSTARVQRH